MRAGHRALGTGHWALNIALVALCGCDRSEGFARMIEQPRAEAYERSDFFPDGASMRMPPAGTVARGVRTGDPLELEGRRDGRYADEIPVAVTRGVLERGRDRFEIYCAACHGVLGDGASAVAERMVLRRPPSLVAPPVRDYPPGRVYATIREGYGLMPSLAAQIMQDDRWAIVAYLRALSLARAVPLADLPPGTREEALRELEKRGHEER